MIKHLAASIVGLWLITVPTFTLLAVSSFMTTDRFHVLLAVVVLSALICGIAIGWFGQLLRLHWLMSLLASVVSPIVGMLLAAVLIDQLMPPCRTLNCPDDRIWRGLVLFVFVAMAGCGLQVLSWLMRHFVSCRLPSRS